MSATLPAVLQIDIVSDVVCPWCYIGKRQLEAALALWQADNPGLDTPVLRWRPFQLNPEMPAEGMPRSAYLQQKFGSPDGGALYDRVTAAARRVDLDLRISAIKTQPNTLKAHALIELAGETGQQDAMAEAFFRAYFVESRDLSDDVVLREIAGAFGLDQGLIDAVLGEESVVRIVAAADAEAREYGVTGVPLFIIGNRAGDHVAVSGAQGADALLAAMRQVQTA